MGLCIHRQLGIGLYIGWHIGQPTEINLHGPIQLLRPRTIDLHGGGSKRRNPQRQLRQNLRLRLHGRPIRLRQLFMAFVTPGLHALGSHLQVPLECPVAPVQKALVQAKRAIQAANGTRGNLKSVVMPVELGNLARQLKPLLRLARDPHIAPPNVGARIAPHPCTHRSGKHLRAKAVT